MIQIKECTCTQWRLNRPSQKTEHADPFTYCPWCGRELSEKASEQKLIDLMFALVFRLHDHPNYFTGVYDPHEAIAKWVTSTLKDNGFIVSKVGSSWGVLQK